MKKENKVKENLQKWVDMQDLQGDDKEFAQYVIDANFIWKYSDRKSVIAKFINTRPREFMFDN